MIAWFFHTAIYYPIYNALAAALSLVPNGDIGLAIILITILIKLILFPLAVKASHTQHAMRGLEPSLKEVKEKHKDDTQELAKATLALYKENGVNPFASVLLLLIQLPIILGLYWVILAEGKGGAFDPALLYSFIPVPAATSFTFLGLIPVAQGSIILALIVAVTQYIQAKLLMPVAPVPTGKGFQDDLASSMHLQMRYVFPIVLGVISYVASAAIALYFITSNIFGIMQELVALRRHRSDNGH